MHFFWIENDYNHKLKYLLHPMILLLKKANQFTDYHFFKGTRNEAHSN